MEALTTRISACFEGAQVCTSCAHTCLGETEHARHLTHCIRLNLDCADSCTTGRMLVRQTQPDLGAGAECQQHAEGGTRALSAQPRVSRVSGSVPPRPTHALSRSSGADACRCRVSPVMG